MRSYFIVLLSLFVVGCAPIQKGDYVTYTSRDYIFIDNNFIDKSIDCIYLGLMKQGDLNVMYCSGVNYASLPVEGFIFEHEYNSYDERFFGSTLSFKTKKSITFKCNSETIDDSATSGREYINCMVPKAVFDLHYYMMNSVEDIHGIFRAPVGNHKVYHGVIDAEGKALLDQFHKDIRENTKTKWKKKKL
jgi:hypothetical protein